MDGDPLRDLRRAPPTPGWRELSERQFRARRHLDELSERQFRARRHLDEVAECLIYHRYELPEVPCGCDR